jgi:hypothetical protein
MRRGSLERFDLSNYEIASLRSQRRLKDFFNNLLNQEFEWARFCSGVSCQKERGMI